jgi:hypothetical protein
MLHLPSQISLSHAFEYQLWLCVTHILFAYQTYISKM